MPRAKGTPWKVDISGQKFGRWLVISRVAGSVWLCRCECGNERAVNGSSLKLGNSTSCGCWSRERSTKHGMEGTPTYNTWAHMLTRCRHKEHKQWADYGGRGIKVCKRWERFEKFLADMGEKPNGLSLDRWPDNDGDYKPSNCRWIDQSHQLRNRRNTVKYEYRGKRRSLSEICEMANLPRRRVAERLRAGWTLELALSKDRK